MSAEKKNNPVCQNNLKLVVQHIEYSRTNSNEDEHNLVDRDEIESRLQQGATTLRSSLEKLERQFGPEALGLVLEAIDEIESGFDE